MPPVVAISWSSDDLRDLAAAALPPKTLTRTQGVQSTAPCPVAGEDRLFDEDRQRPHPPVGSLADAVRPPGPHAASTGDPWWVAVAVPPPMFPAGFSKPSAKMSRLRNSLTEGDER